MAPRLLFAITKLSSRDPRKSHRPYKNDDTGNCRELDKPRRDKKLNDCKSDGVLADQGGRNSKGQLGDGSTNDSSTAVDVAGLSSGVSAIAAGGYYTCTLLDSGALMCWGENKYGQLGDGTETDSATPVDVAGLPYNVTAVSLGIAHTCALLDTGSVKCWGYNGFGHLGDGSTDDSATPVDVVGL